MITQAELDKINAERKRKGKRTLTLTEARALEPRRGSSPPYGGSTDDSSLFHFMTSHSTSSHSSSSGQSPSADGGSSDGGAGCGGSGGGCGGGGD